MFLKEKIKNIFKIFWKFFKWIVLALIVLVFVNYVYSKFVSPNLLGEWEFGQEKKPFVIEKENKKYEVKNFRNFDWSKKEKNEIKKHQDFDFNLDEIIGVDLAVSHFTKKESIAHVFLIFKLKDGNKNFGLSVESRRLEGEKFSLIGGIFYKYNLIYILASENDLFSLRKKRSERLYIYPLKITQEQSQKLFKLYIEKINSLKDKPEFYHTIYTNCTNEIAKSFDKISEIKFPFLEKYFQPGYIDEALFEMGLFKDIKNDNFEEYKKEHLIKFTNEKKNF